MKRLGRITSATGLGLVPLICVLSVMLLICGLNRGGLSDGMAEARYLPTRSDPSEVEALKSIIRQLLVETWPASGRHQVFQARAQPQEPIEQLRSPNYLQRRAAEISVGSSNGAESDGGFLMGPMAQVDKDKNSMQFLRASQEMDGR